MFVLIVRSSCVAVLMPKPSLAVLRARRTVDTDVALPPPRPSLPLQQRRRDDALALRTRLRR